MLLRQFILICVIYINFTFSSITLSCFSFPLFDLPSLGFSSESGLFANSGANFLTNVGANNKTLSADFCFFAIASVLILEVFPSLLSSQGSTLLRRISGPAIDQSSLLPSLDPAPRAPEVNMMPGTRRLDTDVTEYEYVDTYPSASLNSLSWPAPQSLSPSDPRVEDIASGHPPPPPVDNASGFAHPVPVDNVSGYAPPPPVDNVRSYAHPSPGDNVSVHSDPGYGQVVANAQVHSASYSVAEPSSDVQSRHSQSNVKSEGAGTGDSWSHAMEYEDEFAWSVQQFDNSVDSSVVGDGRLSQDYDDIDYTSGNLVSFHTSLAR